MKKDRPGPGESFSPTRRRTTVGGELAGENDVEGHGVKARGPEARGVHARGPEGQAVHARGPLAREGGEDDVEGHGVKARGPEARGVHAHGPLAREGGENDVEGQSLILDPYSARELARARERDVVRQVEHHRLEKEAARRPLKPKSH